MASSAGFSSSARCEFSREEQQIEINSEEVEGTSNLNSSSQNQEEFKTEVENNSVSEPLESDSTTEPLTELSSELTSNQPEETNAGPISNSDFEINHIYKRLRNKNVFRRRVLRLRYRSEAEIPSENDTNPILNSAEISSENTPEPALSTELLNQAERHLIESTNYINNSNKLLELGSRLTLTTMIGIGIGFIIMIIGLMYFSYTRGRIVGYNLGYEAGRSARIGIESHITNNINLKQNQSSKFTDGLSNQIILTHQDSVYNEQIFKDSSNKFCDSIIESKKIEFISEEIDPHEQ